MLYVVKITKGIETINRAEFTSKLKRVDFFNNFTSQIIMLQKGSSKIIDGLGDFNQCIKLDGNKLSVSSEESLDNYHVIDQSLSDDKSKLTFVLHYHPKSSSSILNDPLILKR